MGVFYESIPPSLESWILEQKVLWVATAPLTASGHVNLSPKGGPYFGIVNPTTFWYLDLTGSGSETLSHLHEPGNGRITVLFNAFEGPPRIVRLWGWGEVLEYGTQKYLDFVKQTSADTIPGTRAVIVVHIHQVGSSCGFSMPLFDFKDFRSTLNEFFEKRVAAEEAGNKKDGIERYWAYKNAFSIDGLPGMQRGLETGQKENVKPLKKMVGPRAPKANMLHYPSSVHSRPALSMVLFLLAMVLSFGAGIFTTVFAPLYTARLLESVPK
ncbi:pyridoxamine phosphate oxidase family protein [Aulographum hederae CBS 113979]|uniref:Pyridoxamine phosphate oxidase family protein n=1 Tax=Aulographum hederae CBS 113979 TaxID=1176131 RepID=A0A6G1GJN1_9PEZI|nr:pyridoxamine phosphate oxidase family protein [Aulographum hederae CBS 113979]